MKLLESGHMWFFGIIPLIVGIIFVAQDMGIALLPSGLSLWPTLVFMFGLVYVVMSMMKK